MNAFFRRSRSEAQTWGVAPGPSIAHASWGCAGHVAVVVTATGYTALQVASAEPGNHWREPARALVEQLAACCSGEGAAWSDYNGALELLLPAYRARAAAEAISDVARACNCSWVPTWPRLFVDGLAEIAVMPYSPPPSGHVEYRWRSDPPSPPAHPRGQWALRSAAVAPLRCSHGSRVVDG